MRKVKKTILHVLKKAYRKVQLFFSAMAAFVNYYVEKHELEKADQEALIKPSIEKGKYIIKLIKEEEKNREQS